MSNSLVITCVMIISRARYFRYVSVNKQVNLHEWGKVVDRNKNDTLNFIQFLYLPLMIYLLSLLVEKNLKRKVIFAVLINKKHTRTQIKLW